MAFVGSSLKASHNHHLTFVQVSSHLGWGDVSYFCLGMNTIGGDARLSTGERCCGNTHGVQGHRRQRNGRLFSGRQQHVHFSLGRKVHHFLGHPNESIGHSAHGRDHHNDLVSLGKVTSYSLSHSLDAVGRGHRSTTILLNNERHGYDRPGKETRYSPIKRETSSK